MESTAKPDVVAYVGDHPINRDQVMNLLIEGHGVGVLEQLIVLHAAQRVVDQRGIKVTQADIDAEHDRTLDKLLGDAPAQDAEELRRRAGETVLNEMLASRNISRDEFMIVTRRNAILRKIVLADLQFDEDQLRKEHARQFGERAEIRHVQLAKPSEVDRVVRRLEAGDDIGELAFQFSANRASGEQKGLLPMFTRDDEDVPALLRRRAFEMSAGQRSEALLIDGWYHVIRLERRLPADPRPFDTVRDEVERGLRNRLADVAMQELYAQLFRDARLDIVDPHFRRLFLAKHPDHGAVRK